jgi:hypothetical protein
MEKQLGNSGKRKKPFWPKPAHEARARALATPERRTPPVGANLPRALLSLFLSLAAEWGRDVGAGSLRSSAPLPSLPRGPALPDTEPLPPRAHSLSLSLSLSLCAVGLRCQLRPPRARRGPARTHSRTSPESSATMNPTRPSSLFEPRPRPHSLPASFRTVSPSLALCSCRQTSPETCVRLPGHLARRRPRQATPSSALR